jgi:hypothetical protein
VVTQTWDLGILKERRASFPYMPCLNILTLPGELCQGNSARGTLRHDQRAARNAKPDWHNRLPASPFSYAKTLTTAPRVFRGSVDSAKRGLAPSHEAIQPISSSQSRVWRQANFGGDGMIVQLYLSFHLHQPWHRISTAVFTEMGIRTYGNIGMGEERIVVLVEVP